MGGVAAAAAAAATAAAAAPCPSAETMALGVTVARLPDTVTSPLAAPPAAAALPADRGAPEAACFPARLPVAPAVPDFAFGGRPRLFFAGAAAGAGPVVTCGVGARVRPRCEGQPAVRLAERVAVPACSGAAGSGGPKPKKAGAVAGWEKEMKLRASRSPSTSRSVTDEKRTVGPWLDAAFVRRFFLRSSVSRNVCGCAEGWAAEAGSAQPPPCAPTLSDSVLSRSVCTRRKPAGCGAGGLVGGRHTCTAIVSRCICVSLGFAARLADGGTVVPAAACRSASSDSRRLRSAAFSMAVERFDTRAGLRARVSRCPAAPAQATAPVRRLDGAGRPRPRRPRLGPPVRRLPPSLRHAEGVGVYALLLLQLFVRLLPRR